MTHVRLPLRLARREVWRRPGRTALVALLVALPVGAMTMAVVLIRTDRVTPLEQWERSSGQADAVLFEPQVATADIAEVTDDAVAGELPVGTRRVVVSNLWRRVRTVGGRGADVDLIDLPLNDPIAAGTHDLVDGRAPTARGEIALSTRLAKRLGVRAGEDLVLQRPDVHLEVVGLIEPVGCLSCGSAVVAPGHLGPLVDAQASIRPTSVELLDFPDHLTAADRAQVAERVGERMVLRDAAIDPSADHGADGVTDPVRWSLVLGALVLTVVGIVISAAFAVGARRQLVTLGQLSASGVDAATIRAALVLQGTVTGVVGAAVGLLIAGGALSFGEGTVERILDERIDGYTVRFADVVLAVAIGIGAATLAALIPARSAARIPTLAALSGRRPLGQVSRRFISWGFAAVIAGLALLGLAVVGSRSGQSGELWAYVAILGGVSELLGACALAPAIVARLEPLAAQLSGAWRLGARSLARHRSRTGAVISAVAAAGALAIAAGALLQGSEAGAHESLDLPADVVMVQSVSYDSSSGVRVTSPPQSPARRELETVLPEAEAIVFRTTQPQGDAQGDPAVQQPTYWEVRPANDPNAYLFGSEAVLIADAKVLGLLRVPAIARRALAADGVVLLSDRASAGPMVLRAPGGHELDGLAVKSPHALAYDLSVLISEAKAAELQVDLVEAGVAYRMPKALTQAERDEVGDLSLNLAETGPAYTEVRVHSPPSGPSPFAVELILTGLALAFSLFVVGVNLALAAAESKDERDVLTIGGAPPRLLARSAGARAALMAGLGGALALPVGFLPVVVFTSADGDGGIPLVFPARTALVLVLLVPVVVALASWAASAASQWLRPVRVSTATFE